MKLIDSDGVGDLLKLLLFVLLTFGGAIVERLKKRKEASAHEGPPSRAEERSRKPAPRSAAPTPPRASTPPPLRALHALRAPAPRRAGAAPGPAAREAATAASLAADPRLAPLAPAAAALDREDEVAGPERRLALARGRELLRAALLQRLAEGADGPLALADRLLARMAQDARDPRWGKRPLVALHPIPGAARHDASLPFDVVLVPPDVAARPWRWAHVVREAWRARWTGHPETEQSLASVIGPPDPDLWEDSSYRAAVHLLSDATSELAADAAATLALGPAWVDALRADARSRPPAERGALRPGPEPFGAHLPGVHRDALALALLDGAGLRLEADDRRAAAASERPPAIVRLTGASVDYFRVEGFDEHAEDVATRLRKVAIAPLGGPLAGLPALADTGRVAASADVTRERLLRGERVVVGWREAIATLAGLPPHASDDRVRLAARELLLDALAKGEAEPARARARRAATTAVTSAGARARAWRDAIVMGEVLTPASARERSW